MPRRRNNHSWISSIRWLLLSLLCGTLAPFATAASPALSWEIAEHKVTASPGQETVLATYPFRNTSGQPLRIVGIDTGCVCTVATTGKSDFAPGEAGELRVEFVLGERVGHQARTITLTTADPNAPRPSVKLVVDIPELALVRPRLLFWAIGAKPEIKSAEIVLVRPATSRIDFTTQSSPDFTIRLLPTGRPGTYRLEVAPLDTSRSVQLAIHVPAVVDGAPRTLSVFAAVK